eukprot:5244394-Alexandrium_andersonii.AAC.1
MRSSKSRRDTISFCVTCVPSTSGASARASQGNAVEAPEAFRSGVETTGHVPSRDALSDLPRGQPRPCDVRKGGTLPSATPRFPVT